MTMGLFEQLRTMQQLGAWSDRLSATSSGPWSANGRLSFAFFTPSRSPRPLLLPTCVLPSWSASRKAETAASLPKLCI